MFSKDQMLGKYRIIERLGAGGFGTVYLAEDRLNRRVALKIPHQQADKDALLEEPRLMAKLRHQNIVAVITDEEIDGYFFYSMEYVEGISLDRQIKQEGRLKPQRALEIAIGVCSALEVAHEQKILHRDLRPANILMTKDGVPKVTDFGTSRFLEQEFARTRIGSPPYMAPEHFRGRTVFQSDLWSLGISIYEMLTGKVPFYDADPVKIAHAYTTQKVVPPHLCVQQLPKALSEIVMKALSINLGERHISAQVLRRELQGLLAPITNPQINQVENQLQNRPIETPNQYQNLHLCRFCHRPLPRMATSCPNCGEKN